MDAAPPKRKRRRWPWVTVVGFVIVTLSVGLWIFVQSDKIEEGDAGHICMLWKYKRLRMIETVNDHLPAFLQEAAFPLLNKAYTNFWAQTLRLEHNGTSRILDMYVSTMPASFSNGGMRLTDRQIMNQIALIAADQRYPLCFYRGIEHIGDDLMLQIILRSNDVPALMATYGIASSVTFNSDRYPSAPAP